MPQPQRISPVPLVYFLRLVTTLRPLLTLPSIGPSATQKICVQDVLLKRVFSVSIYFRSVRSRQVQPFLVLSSKHGAICHFSATGPEDLLTSLKSSSDQATRYWSYIRIRTKPPQLFQICQPDLHPSPNAAKIPGNISQHSAKHRTLLPASAQNKSGECLTPVLAREGVIIEG